MKYRVVGDIHGQIELMKMAMNGDHDKVIFVGDLVDSWDRSVDDQIKCVEYALEFVDKGRMEVLWANHEWSYLDPIMRCSGYNSVVADYLIPFKNDVLTKFKPFWYEGFLITHAGLTKQLWDEHKLTLDNFEQVLTEWSKHISSPFFQISRYRGGYAPVGGPLWCDFRHEFIPIPELPQIFGHSRGKGIRQNGNSFCIDTLENTAPQFFDFEVNKDNK